ncbi:hypothetical protein CVS42_10560 [Aeromonas veronii]|uniref:hypothetical protein n=1 Tax=Aeromonas veronii TaxID=654 RepID=UPI000C29278F|nr:hypothetical protein [Aeromonas veronii]ATY81224.1 hypothetical protein CVS42_10560 [Aeromonas veronii]
MLIAIPDEGDDGVGSVIDTTKVTSSTPADQTLPSRIRSSSKTFAARTGRPKNGLRNTQKPLGAMASCLVLLSNWQVIIKSNRTKIGHLLTDLLS